MALEPREIENRAKQIAMLLKRAFKLVVVFSNWDEIISARGKRRSNARSSSTS